MKRLVAILAVLVAFATGFGLPLAMRGAFAQAHQDMEHAMPCDSHDCAPSAAACAAHCLATAVGTVSVPAVPALAVFVVALVAVAATFPRLPAFRFVAVSTGPPGRFESRLLTVMLRE